MPPIDVPDLYEREKKIAQMCQGAMQRKYAGETNMGSEAVQKRFILEAKGMYAENGLDVVVTIDPDVSDDPGDRNIYWTPTFTVIGRVDKVTSFDHERQQHEVRNGVYDGVKGVIDPNTGQMRDEPKKKIIT